MTEQKKLVAMSPMEWTKPNSKTGISRVDILEELIQRGASVIDRYGNQHIVDTTDMETYSTLNTLRNIVNSTDPTALKLLTKDLCVATTTGERLPLVYFGKSAEFGGGTGSKFGNAHLTDANEFVTIAIVSYAVNFNKCITPDDVSRANMMRANKWIICNKDLDEDCIHEILANKTWRKSVAVVANVLAEVINPGMVFHYHDDFFKRIYDTSKKLSSVFSQQDKWNPADFFVSSSELNWPTQFYNLDHYNAFLLKEQNAGTLYSISLKKITSETPTLHYYNVGQDDDLQQIDLVDIHISRTDDLFSSKSIYLEITNGTERTLHVVRSFEKSNLTVSLELSANACAKGGKIGQSKMNEILNDVGLRGFHTTEYFTSMFDHTNTTHERVLPLIKYAHSTACMLDRKFNSIDDNTIRHSLEIILKRLGDDISPRILESYIITKCHSLQLAYTLYTATGLQRTEFIRQAIRYASSRSALSAPHIRVS